MHNGIPRDGIKSAVRPTRSLRTTTAQINALFPVQPVPSFSTTAHSSRALAAVDSTCTALAAGRSVLCTAGPLPLHLCSSCHKRSGTNAHKHSWTHIRSTYCLSFPCVTAPVIPAAFKLQGKPRAQSSRQHRKQCHCLYRDD